MSNVLSKHFTILESKIEHRITSYSKGYVIHARLRYIDSEGSLIKRWYFWMEETPLIKTNWTGWLSVATFFETEEAAALKILQLDLVPLS